MIDTNYLRKVINKNVIGPKPATFLYSVANELDRLYEIEEKQKQNPIDNPYQYTWASIDSLYGTAVFYDDFENAAEGAMISSYETQIPFSLAPVVFHFQAYGENEDEERDFSTGDAIELAKFLCEKDGYYPDETTQYEPYLKDAKSILNFIEFYI